MPGGGRPAAAGVRRLAGVGQAARRARAGVRAPSAPTASSAVRWPRTCPRPSAPAWPSAVGAAAGRLRVLRRRARGPTRWRCSARRGWRSARRCGLIDESAWSFLWVVDAPLFEPVELDDGGSRLDGGAPPVHLAQRRVGRPLRAGARRGAGLGLRHRLQRQRDRRRLDPYPPPRRPAAGLRPARAVAARRRRRSSASCSTLRVRAAAARRHRLRLGPDLHAARRRRPSPRGDRVPEDRRRLRPADRGADPDHALRSARRPASTPPPPITAPPRASRDAGRRRVARIGRAGGWAGSTVRVGAWRGPVHLGGRRPRGRVAPLAVRMRPRTLDEVVGQDHLLAAGSPLRRLVEGPARRRGAVRLADPVGAAGDGQDHARAPGRPGRRTGATWSCRR